MALIRTLEVTLSPDETVTFDIPLVFRDEGCSGGRGGRTTFEGFPVVTVDYLLNSYERPAGNDLVHRQAGPARGCADLGE